jgi:hypothetical protein
MENEQIPPELAVSASFHRFPKALQLGLMDCFLHRQDWTTWLFQLHKLHND